MCVFMYIRRELIFCATLAVSNAVDQSILAALAKRYIFLEWKTHYQLNSKFSDQLSPWEFDGVVVERFKLRVFRAARMHAAERFRFLLVKLRAFTDIASKRIIAEGLSRLAKWEWYLFLVVSGVARNSNVVSDRLHTYIARLQIIGHLNEPVC